jgi:SpoVK/Ycf46/Vps4 family AAA+-type ATPase
MLYGQKATGKTFFALNIMPKLLNDVNFEYIDMNKMLIQSQNFSNMSLIITYLSNLFLNYDERCKKIFIIDHLDCALPKIESSEMMHASKIIKQTQLLMFFLDLIDSKKYSLFFIGRHYQNIVSELAAVSRIDEFVQIVPPDFKKRKLAFELIISTSFKPGKQAEYVPAEERKIQSTKRKAKFDKVISTLAAKTEHHRFSNLVQVKLLVIF